MADAEMSGKELAGTLRGLRQRLEVQTKEWGDLLDIVHVTTDAGRVHVFDTVSGARLSE